MPERPTRSEVKYLDQISFIRKHYPWIYTDAGTYLRLVITQAGRNRLVNALAALAIVGGSKYLRLLSVCSTHIATEMGSDPVDLAFGLSPVKPKRVIDLADVGQIDRTGKVGWMHGFFRLLTPASATHLAQAGELCDILIVGRESLSRCRKHKGRILFSDDQINSMLLCPHLCDFVVLIDDRTVYTNDGYRDIVRKVKPDVYFGNAGYSEAIRMELQKRAELVGAQYKELPVVHGKSTTDFFAATRQI